jgi:hypothetical protein
VAACCFQTGSGCDAAGTAASTEEAMGQLSMVVEAISFPVVARVSRAIPSGSRCSRHGCLYPSTRARWLSRVPFQAWCVAPKVFQTVEGAFGLMKDMDNHLEIIKHDPLAGGKSINGGRANTVILL